MSKTNRLLYFLALLKIIIPYLLQNPVYEPHRDEFLYLAEGHHLAWGFMEVPPVLSLFAWLTHLFGDGIFWVKLWPSLTGAAVFIISGKIIQSLGGKNFGLILLFLAFIFSGYLRVFFLFQPNPPEILFWTLIAFSFIRYVQTKENKWLYLFGISVGLGMLSKYSVAFYTVSILLSLLLTPHRKVFANKHFWYAGLIGFIIFLPNLIWQYKNNFPVVVHMQELQQTQLQYVNPGDFLKDQVIIFLPCFFIWITGLIFCLLSRQFRFIGLAYVFVITLLLIGHGKDYYSLGVYPPLFSFGAVAFERYTAVKRRWLRFACIIFIFIIGISFIPIALPILPPRQLADLYVKLHTEKTGTLKWEDLQNHPLPQDFADMLSWKEMTQKVAKAYSTLTPEEKKHTLLFCDNYGQAGAVSFYASRYNLPQVYSDNASFLYWLPDTMHIDNLLLVTDDENEMQHPFIKNFSSAVLEDSITNAFAREHGSLIILMKDANADFNKMFHDKIAKDKAEFKY